MNDRIFNYNSKGRRISIFPYNFLATFETNSTIRSIVRISRAIFPFLFAIPSIHSIFSQWRRGQGRREILDQFGHERFFPSRRRLPPKSLSCLVKSRKAAGVNTNGIPRRDSPPSSLLPFSKLPLSSGAHSLFRRYARHRLLEGTSRGEPSRVVHATFSRLGERIINRNYNETSFPILVGVFSDTRQIIAKLLQKL